VKSVDVVDVVGDDVEGGPLLRNKNIGMKKLCHVTLR
jgi:hypothetical protein